MLKTLVGLLLLANLAFYAWSQGWLDDIVGVPAHGDREPERLSRQVRPETVRVLTPQAVAAAASDAQSRLVCLEAGPFDADGLNAAETALVTTLPRGIWTVVEMQRAGIRMHTLRVAGADPDLAAKVAGLQLDALGKGFVPCGRTP